MTDLVDGVTDEVHEVTDVVDGWMDVVNGMTDVVDEVRHLGME